MLEHYFLGLIMSFFEAPADSNSNCTSDDNENEETGSTSNESTASFSSVSFSPELNTTSWDEHQINLKVGEIEGWLDNVKACLNCIRTCNNLKCQEMKNVMTLIDATDDLRKCTMRSARRISRPT